MKLKRRRALEVPQKIKSFIDTVVTTPLENIQEPLKTFFWDFEKGDFHHWVDLFNHFDTFFEKIIKPRKDLQLVDDFLDSDPPFPKDGVLQILRVIRIVLENCTNKHFYSSYENHLSSLLASTDADVVESCLTTLAAFLKKSIGKYIIRDASLNSRLFAFAQGWGKKEEGLGLVSCALQNGSDSNAMALGSTLHFEFYSVNESSNKQVSAQQPTQGLQIIHIPDVNGLKESDLELLNKLVVEYKVHHNLRFSLLTRLRFARAFSSLTTRQQYTCIRLYAFVVLVQSSGETEDLSSFFHSEPEFINELVSLLSFEDTVPEKIRILSLLSLVAVCPDRTRQASVLTAVTSGGHHGILSSLMQKAVNSIVNNSSKWSVVFVEALLSLVTVLVSSSPGCSAMREAGFIPTLLPLLKDTDPCHLHLVTTAVHVLEAFMDYSNPAAALFRDLGGLDDTVSRLMVEVRHVENGSKQQPISIDLDSSECVYSEALVSYRRRLLMKALLRAISLGTYAPGPIVRMYGTEESLLPNCLCVIFKKAKDFGGGVFSLAATVMSDLIHKDPTCFPILEEAGLPSTFMDAIMDGVLCSAEAITCIPQCLDALCLNNNGLQAVKERNALRCFVKVFTSKMYLRALAADTTSSLSSGLDELMRHAASLRGPGVDMLIEILNVIAQIGSGLHSTSQSNESCSQSVPMEMESESRDIVLSGDKPGSSGKSTEASTDETLMNVDAFLPDCISHAARLLETILQNSDTCRIFVEKKGVECVLKLFTLPLMPLSDFIPSGDRPRSIGQTIAVAFKNFSPQHSASLARSVCSVLKEHLKYTDELLTSVQGSQLVQVEFSKRMKVLRCLSSLEGIISLSSSLLKGTTTLVSELGSSDLLKDLGKAYKEVMWQLSLCYDTKQTVEPEPEAAVGPSNLAGRESDDDVIIPNIRHMNPASIRNASHSQLGADREFLTMVRASEGFSRRSRHSWARLRGGRAGRHLEAMQMDADDGGSSAESPSHEIKKSSPETVVSENLNKIASTLLSFFSSLVKGFASPNRRRSETGSLSSASKNIGTALAKIFFESLGFSGYPNADMSPLVKCRYIGKIVNGMIDLTFDKRRRTCHPAMINNFYVHGTFKELLTTFEATCQLLWASPSITDAGNSVEESKLSQDSWLLDTLMKHCRELEYFVNSGLLLSSSQSQLLVQPVAVGLSIGLFPVPKDPEAFVRVLQSQVLDVLLPIWNHPMFPNSSAGFITSVTSLITHVCSGVSGAKGNNSVVSGNLNQRFMPPPPDEATITTIVEMGFSRARAEEALRRVETNSVEMAMEWLFSHAEDPVMEDDELARALALSLGNSSETPKVDAADKSTDVVTEEGHTNMAPADDLLSVAMKLFQSSDSMAFPLTDLIVTLCGRNNGEDRPKVVSYLVQQLRLCPLEFTKDGCALGMISHTLALVLSEDGNTREIAAQNGIVSIAIDILTNFIARTEASDELLVPKCISTLLLILDNLVQLRHKLSGDSANERRPHGPLPGNKISSDVMEDENDILVAAVDKNESSDLESIIGKPTGYLTTDESRNVLIIACDLIKRHVPPMIMQAIFQLCARLTKSHVLAMQFLESGGMVALFGIPRSCFFPGYDTLASAIVRHLLEDPQTLQTAMELEIRQTLSGSRQAGRVSVKTFLTTMAPVLSRDPVIFMKAVAAVCQLEESSGGRSVVMLSKDKPKAAAAETGLPNTEIVRVTENKAHEGSSSKFLKSHKKVSPNFTQVIDYLLEIVSTYPSQIGENGLHPSAMDVDEPVSKLKGKAKVDGTEMIEPNNSSEKSAAVAKVTFVLKLLSDILLMYVHAVGVILRRDMEICIVHHVLHRLLPISVDKSDVPDEWRDKLSEKASWFLVVLAGRSNEGRRRVVNELVKALSNISNVVCSSSSISILPDKKVHASVDLVYSILSKNSSSASLPSSGCSPDIAKSMIDGGMVRCLSGILQVIDLDHPDAPKTVNLILKSLECLTRAANANEQLPRTDTLSKKTVTGSNGRSDALLDTSPARQELQSTGFVAQTQDISQNNVDQIANTNQSAEQEMGIDQASTADLGADYMREDMEENIGLPNEEIEMNFHVENRVVDDMNDEEDDMGDGDDDDDDDEDEEDDGEDEEDDMARDGTGLMSLADTDVDDHDDAGLGDEYNDDMVDEEDDDFHENRVIEVRWREALDGLDHLQVLGQQPGAGGGLINVSNEPFEGVNVDDFFGVRRSFAFERRRQVNRNERPVTEASITFQHPLLTRPSRSGDMVPMWSSSSRNPSRDSDGLSNGNADATRFPSFGAPISFFDDLLGGPSPPMLDDFTVGLESLYVSGRRGPGDGRWTDDGQPQAGGLAAEIAQAVEERIISQLRESNPTENSGGNPEGDPIVAVGNSGGQHDDVLPHGNGNGTSQVAELESQEANLEAVAEQALEFPQENESAACLNGNSSMEAEEGNTIDTYTLGNSLDGNNRIASLPENLDVDMSVAEEEQDQFAPQVPPSGVNLEGPSAQQNDLVVEDAAQNGDNSLNGDASSANGIDPTFLEALPEDLRAEVLASQQARAAPPAPTYAPPTIEDIDPEFLAALPPDIQAEVLAQQRAQRIMQQSEGQPVDMDNASIIATFPADLREEVLLTSSEAVLSALPSPLLAEAQMLRDRAMSHYHARSSLFGSGHRLSGRGNRIGFGQSVMDRGVGVTIGRGASSVGENLKLKELEGEPLLDASGLKALIRLLRLAQPLGKGLLQRLLLNLCSHSDTRALLVRLLLDMVNPETVSVVGGPAFMSSQRLYGCQSEVVYGRSQVCDGVPPLVLRRVLEILTYLATSHSGVSSLLFHFEATNKPECTNISNSVKGKEKVIGYEHHVNLSGSSQSVEVPLILLLRLLGQPLFLQSVSHLEQVMGLLQVVVCAAAAKVVIQSNHPEESAANTEGPSTNLTSSNVQTDPPVSNIESVQLEGSRSKSDGQKSLGACDVFLLLPPSDLHNLCSLLGHEGLSDKVYTLAGELLRKLASVAASHRKYFISELSELAQKLSSPAVSELITLKDTRMLGLNAGSMGGASVLRVLQILSALVSFETDSNKDKVDEEDQDEHATMWKLNMVLEPLWKELSECINTMESELNQNNSSVISQVDLGEQIHPSSSASPPLPPGTQRLLPYIEGFFVLCEKLQSNSTPSLQQDNSSATATATEVKEHVCSSSQINTKSVDTYRKFDGSLTFARFAERHRRLLNAFVRQNPGLLEKSLSVMLKAPRLIDFDNKKAYFRTKIRQQHDQHLSGPLRISVRRAYILEDSYNQLRMRPSQDLKGRLNVHFQGEEGIDAGGLTREWYQVLSRVVFDKGALLFTTVGNNATFQPNPNSVFQTEHLSYFRFVGRVVAKALLDGQLLDVYFTRSFYKHILGVKVTYHDIEAVDPDYYKNLKWMLENDVNDIPDLTFSMDADEEKHILYEKTEVTDYELKPGGRNIRVTEESKHEYIDLVADHILTNAIRPQINSFLEGFNELVPRELISIFNDKELELLISGLPEIDLDDMKANTEYTGYTIASSIVQWFWEVVKGFNKEDTARFLQFITGTSKVPLEGFKALQGISGPQRFQIHKAYGAPERLPSAHTCFNQLDLPEYSSKEQLQERLLLAIHEASEGFGFG